jgi:hypothetical protein
MDPMHSQEAGELDDNNAQGQATANALLQPWYVPESHFEELPGVMCATDLLVAWEPETAVSPLTEFGTAGVWDAYFQGTAAATALPGIAVNVQEIEEHDEAWDPDAAAAAVECLFRFVHAIERTDVEQAILCVAEDYHAFERDIDFDRDALKLWLERMVDEWRGPELRISMTEIPDPIFHPLGVLIHVTLQVDYRNKFRDALETLRFGYIVVLDAEPRKEWLIRSLCRIN